MARSESPVPFWTLAERFQRQADRTHLDHWAWIADEQLVELFRRSDQSDLSPDEQVRFAHLAHNRTKKYFRRKHLLLARERTRGKSSGEQFGDIDIRDELDAVRRLISATDWELLRRLAEGADYQTLADELVLPVGTVKARVSRARKQIRGEI